MEEKNDSPDLNQQKEQLYKSAKEIKKALNEEVDNIKQNAGELSKLLLITGGIFLISYSIISSFRKSRPKKDVREYQYPVQYQPSENSIIKTIKEQIALFLVSIAKNKIRELLNQKEIIDQDERDHS